MERGDFQSNGLRYWLEPAISGRSSCGSCKGSIGRGSTRFGASKDGAFHGSFFWRHIHCVTGRQLQNVADTYWDGSLDESMISSIPGFTNLSDDSKELVISHFEPIIATQIRVADAYAGPIEDLDWRTLLANGELDGLKAEVPKRILKFIGKPVSGSKAELLQRLHKIVNDEKGLNMPSDARVLFKEESKEGDDEKNEYVAEEEEAKKPVAKKVVKAAKKPVKKPAAKKPTTKKVVKAAKKPVKKPAAKKPAAKAARAAPIKPAKVVKRKPAGIDRPRRASQNKTYA